MRQYLVAGNWKMNGSSSTATGLVRDIANGISQVTADVVICPPFTLLSEVKHALEGSVIALGGQDCAQWEVGAYTGEVSAAMLVDVGCHCVILGHSERRALLGETNAVIAQKFIVAQKAGLTPILCLGESLQQRDNNETLDVISTQLEAIIDVVGVEALQKSVIAYEPVWAIGTGKTASPEQAQEVHQFIRLVLSQHDAELSKGIRIIYGGSVNASNAKTLFAQPDIDGALVGGAALKSEDFIAICQQAGHKE